MGERRVAKERGERRELLAVGGEAWRANEWKNGEISRWKINSAVEREGLPPLLLGVGRWTVSWEGGGGVEHTNHGSRYCWP